VSISAMQYLATGLESFKEHSNPSYNIVEYLIDDCKLKALIGYNDNEIH
jgi:hypothetical protein